MSAGDFIESNLFTLFPPLPDTSNLIDIVARWIMAGLSFLASCIEMFRYFIGSKLA